MNRDDRADAGMDRLLRDALRATPAADANVCPPACDLAAFLEGGLSSFERDGLERHLAACGRCQQTLTCAASVLPSTPAAAASRPWFGWSPLRWLVPATALAGAALFTYLVVRPTFDLKHTAAPASTVADQAATRAPESKPVPSRELGAQDVAPPPSPVSPPTPSLGSKTAGAGKETALGRLARAEGQPPPATRQHAVPAKPKADAVPPAEAAGGAAGVAGAAAAGAQAQVYAPAPPPLTLEARQAPPAGRMQAPVQAQAPSQLSGQAQVAGQVQPGQAAQQAPPPVPMPPEVARARPTQTEITRAPRGAMKAEARMSDRPAVREITTPDGAFRWRIEPGSGVSRSRDAGLTWEVQPTGIAADFLAGAAPDQNTCWLVGRRGAVAVTVEGERWTSRPFPESIDLVRVSARDGLHATVSARDGRRFVTTDGGATWTIQN